MHQQGIKFFSNGSVSNLQALLDQEMAGLQRLPTLLFHMPNKNLVDINLQKYETINNELLHDKLHHNQNLFDELPYHALKEMKQTLEKVINTSFNGKEAKNSAD